VSAELPEALSTAALTGRLASELADIWRVGRPFTPGGETRWEVFAAELVPEVRRIMVDVLLTVTDALADSDGCQDFPYDLAQAIDGEHLHERLSAHFRRPEEP
jgi:hypothetical protein